MIELRPYQERSIAALRGAFSAGRKAPVLVLPTGAGKTVVAAKIIHGSVERGKRVLFLAHRTELIGQTVSKLSRAGVHNIRVIQAARDLGYPDAPVIVASVQTVTSPRWLAQLPVPDLIIIDECHHLVARSWHRIVAHYPAALRLGLTATPQRGDGRPLGDVFDDLVVGATVRELTDLGHLVPCRVWAPPRKLDTAQLALDPVAAYLEHGNSERAIVFAVTVAHARRIAADFTAAGIPTGIVTGDGKRAERADTLARFATGELRACVSVGVLTEGWDDPDCVVCIMARRPEEPGLFIQMAGRVLRPAPGKTHATLIDLCGSVHDHGPPDMERVYSLDGTAISGAADRQAIRQCTSCGSVFVAGPEACPHCGVELPARPLAMPRVTGVGVVEITGNTLPPRPMKPIRINAKHPGRCSKCDRWFARETPIWWADGRKPQHQQCPPREIGAAA